MLLNFISDLGANVLLSILQARHHNQQMEKTVLILLSDYLRMKSYLIHVIRKACT